MMPRKIPFCMAVCLMLTSVYAAQKKTLDSIKDLINCPLSRETNVLELLHWFANKVNSYEMQLTFNPNSEFGSHLYANHEGLLDRLPWGYHYYTIGSLSKPTSNSLPNYVRKPQRWNITNNRARIIIRAYVHQPEWIIDQVFITQHYHTHGEGTEYDQEHTYIITLSLLQEISRTNINELQQLAEEGSASTRLHGSSILFTEQARYYPTTNNNVHDCLKAFCLALLFIFVMFVVSLFAYINNRK